MSVTRQTAHPWSGPSVPVSERQQRQADPDRFRGEDWDGIGAVNIENQSVAGVF